MKNFKKIGSPMQVTVADEEFNSLTYNIPRQQLPYNYYLGSVESNELRPTHSGNRVHFEVTKQVSEQNLITPEQIPQEGSIPAYTLFKLKPGHLYRLYTQVYRYLSGAGDAYGWFHNEDVSPGTQPDESKMIGKIGEQAAEAFWTPAVGFIDTLKATEETEVVVAFIVGSSDKPLKGSYVEIVNIPNKTGPWN